MPTSLSPSAAPRSGRRPRQKGWWIPLLFFGFFGIIVGVNAIMVTFALRTFPGVYAENHYRIGLEYNELLARERAQTEQGWQLGLSYGDRGHRSGTLEVSLLDRDGAPIPYAQVTASFLRPTVQGHDFDLPLTHRGDASYAASVDLPLAGNWDVRVVAHTRDGQHQQIQRIWVRD